MIRFDNRVAIVTGAGAGLGREYALLLAARGAKVVVNDIGSAMDGRDSGSTLAAAAVVEEIRAAGGLAIASNDSVADPASAQRIVDAALKEWGRVDILINNAGILRVGPLQAMALEDMHAMIAVHLMGTLYCTRAVLPLMIAQSYGRIVLTSSGVGLRGLADHCIYGATKSAMLGLMDSIKLDCKDNGVIINTVAPSAETRMSKETIRKELARHMSPRVVAPMVAWLCSENCTQSGMLLSAGGGYFYKVAFYKGPGVQFDPAQPLTLEMIDENWPRIIDMSRVEPFLGTLAGLEPNLRKLGHVA
jgi:NAD(P)-dependent dehydrogenase (short-subunit alcohol dehydrogenase family)